MKITRRYFDSLLDQVSKPYISVLIGPRQVGKSFLMQELEKKFRMQGKTTVFYNLEFPDDLFYFSKTESDVIKMLLNGPDVIFIDEFHYLKNATKILKAVYDTAKKKKIYVSGSSSIEIHRHLKESLAGRFRITEIGTLTLGELSNLKGYKEEEYLIMGGLPGLLHEETANEKMALLKNIVQTYLLKDIKALIREENIRAFNHLLNFLAQNQGSISSVAGFAREVRLSEPAVNHHLDIMEQTRVCIPLASYSGNLSNELKKSRKYYLYDLGIRNSLLNDFSKIHSRQDKGILLESFVLLTLYRLLKPNMELRFWRTRQGEEVDFILIKNRIPFPIEVKFSIDKLEIPAGMKKFLSSYRNAPCGWVISMNRIGSVDCEGRKINFIKWNSLELLDVFVNE